MRFGSIGIIILFFMMIIVFASFFLAHCIILCNFAFVFGQTMVWLNYDDPNLALSFAFAGFCLIISEAVIRGTLSRAAACVQRYAALPHQNDRLLPSAEHPIDPAS